MGGNKRPTQRDRILRHMKDIGGITQAEAMSEYGVMRLASRISEIKDLGYPVKREWVHNLNRYGEKVTYLKYSLEEVDE